MLCATFLTWSSLLASALAAATSKSTAYVDKYDNIPSPVIVTQLNAVPVGMYNGLRYTGFIVGHDGITGTNGGINETSHPQTAIGNLLGATTTIDTTYSNSPVRCFDLDQFFFGCSPNAANNEANLPVGCDVAVNGFDLNGKPVGEAIFRSRRLRTPKTRL
ncbi:MAG: hypothetical protein M1828_003278 [Chrysothrix sp. TS-e1954]|nr:MAG: hypothetical protein M1828_003278 [Chrysothrix sp. TS-e1954]